MHPNHGLFFNDETLQYLKELFKKANIDEGKFDKILEWLHTAPKWSTIRINTNVVLNRQDALDEIQNFLNNSYEKLNEKLSDSDKITDIPKCELLNDLIDECITFKCTTGQSNQQLKPLNKIVIIDLKCAQAVLRGADIFMPGILALSLDAKRNDEISIYADLAVKCLQGSDPNKYILNNANNVYFIGNGWIQADRDDIFKNSSNFKSGIGVQIKMLRDNYYIPSLDDLDGGKYFLQNLPSMVCARVLDVREGQLILDMCAAPGGKTTHLAELVKNQSKIIAFDKIANKIEKLKELCARLGAVCIECHCQDVTKIDFNVYKPGSFDRVLVDAPCSALGQRPLIFNNVTVNQLTSYIGYQKKILEKAVELVKPGGILVYSTCTITVEENEQQVSWLLNKYPHELTLVDQQPYYSASRGLPCAGLSDKQRNLLQRFMPDVTSIQSVVQSAYTDTNGFFIAKFLKQ